MHSHTIVTNSPSIPLVDTIIKALEILECFNPQETELSLNQLCDKSGMYKSRVHRLCGTLIVTKPAPEQQRHHSLNTQIVE